jgi:nondiscriminating aspartyl-tRNA synthetase
MRILAADVNKYVDSEIELAGWIHRVRDLGKVTFVILRDRSGSVQLVFDTNPGFAHETVVNVKGRAQANDKAPGGVEVHVMQEDVNILAEAVPDLPVPVNQDPEKLSIDVILDYRMISLRIPKIRSIFNLQSGILKLFAEHMRGESFTEIKTSKLIGTGTEGGTGLFPVEYFDTKVFLAQSPQFYKQAMISSGMERVFEIGNAYRAEKHDTPRHLNEYVSLDVEMAFIETEHDLMDLEQRILKTIFSGIQEGYRKELEEWDASVPDEKDIDRIPRLTHDEAKKLISEKQGGRVFEINPEGERVLCDWAMEKHGIDAVFIYEWPRKKRPFYTYPLNNKTRSFDLLFRGLEITTGGRRINEYPMLLEALPKFGLAEEGLGDYIHIFKYGCPPHGGFAIGLERLTQQILGLSNVKEASLFPRDRKRIKP